MPNGRKQRLLMKWDAHKGVFHRLSKNTNSEVNSRCNMCEFCKDIAMNNDEYMKKDTLVEILFAEMKMDLGY